MHGILGRRILESSSNRGGMIRIRPGDADRVVVNAKSRGLVEFKPQFLRKRKMLVYVNLSSEQLLMLQDAY
ncbi:hypothetical protein N7447_002729 [Penicillium robsamsonii]|uniref:uncharacterized protein n=1 Tax=Penicillium robsamsonii TaxID=1792511 RepID=UPI0025492400|nr:uncharacterized protein N7447_002729 [Penicillium robsamsonii]KAJ5836703.1 hypothetical protein N7447_002729 [Penicillium robsamsonii]